MKRFTRNFSSFSAAAAWAKDQADFTGRPVGVTRNSAVPGSWLAIFYVDVDERAATHCADETEEFYDGWLVYPSPNMDSEKLSQMREYDTLVGGDVTNKSLADWSDIGDDLDSGDLENYGSDPNEVD